jgi:hypothetical protein
MVVEVGPHTVVTVKGPIVTSWEPDEPPDVVTVNENSYVPMLVDDKESVTSPVSVLIAKPSVTG